MEKECPLGGQCEKCIMYLNWYTTELATEKVEHTKQCLFISQTQFLGDMSKKLDRNQAAVESFRNEMVKGQMEFNTMISRSSNLRRISNGNENNNNKD